jgi:hypothetical protein
MADRRRVPLRAALRVGPFVFDRTHPDEKACADYILAAPVGYRLSRIRDLLLLGYRTLRERHTPRPPNDNEG